MTRVPRSCPACGSKRIRIKLAWGLVLQGVRVQALFQEGNRGIEMNIEKLKEMKAQMARRGNWNEVMRINTMLKLRKKKKITLSESKQTAEVSEKTIDPWC